MELLERLSGRQIRAVFPLLPLVVIFFYQYCQPLQIRRFREKEPGGMLFSAPDKGELLLDPLKPVVPFVSSCVTGLAFEVVLQEAKDALDYLAARQLGVAELQPKPAQPHLGLVPVDLIAATMQKPCGAPHPVLVVESSAGKAIPVGDNRGQVTNVVRGIVALGNQDVAQNEGCPTIAHREELAANDLKAFFILDLIIVGQSHVVGLKPVAGTEGRGIAVNEGTI